MPTTETPTVATDLRHSATTLWLCKASATVSDEPIPSLTVHVEREVPDFDALPPTEALEAIADCYQEQAERLGAALWEALPQGTMHALLGVLLTKYASLYRGKCGT